MGQKTILAPIQRKFLELVQAENYLTKRYYWTGGTVFSEVYLHYRNSEDIDLFTEKEEVYLPLAKVITVKDLPRMLVPFDQKAMENFLLKLAKSLDNDIFKN